MSSTKNQQRGRPKTNIEKEQPPSKKIKIEKAFTTISKQPANIKLSTKKTTTQNVTKNQQKQSQISTRSGRKIKKPSFLSSYENPNHNGGGGGGGKAEEDGDDGEKPLEHDSTTTTVETGISDMENDENRYDSIAAILPTFMDLSLKINDDGKDLDELVIDGKEMELLKDEEINNYILACQAKSQKCNIHFALTHLAANKYSIKTALETFDRKFCGKNLSEFWTSDELKTFVRIMNNKNNHKQKSYKNMHKISKNIPNKSTGDVVNAYYALKKNICSFGRVFTICPEIIKTRKVILGYEYVESIKCENCVKHLWKHPSLKYDINNLCSLCKLYHILCGKFRPNAKSCISQMFDTSSMTHEKCLYKMSKDDFNDHVFIPDWNMLKMNVYKIKSTEMKTFIDSTKDFNIDQNTEDMIAATENMKENYTYIFFSKNSLSNLLQFYPQNDFLFFECLNFIDPPETSENTSALQNDDEMAFSDDEEYGSPPILIKERYWNEKEQKRFDVFYFGYFDEKNELHNEYGLEFQHAYMEMLQSFTDPPYFSVVKKVNETCFETDSAKDKADKELIERYGNISFSIFSQAFMDSKRKFKATAGSLNVPVEYLEAYVRQNYKELKSYFAQYERMIKSRIRRAKKRNVASASDPTTDEREKRPNYFSFKETPKKRQNYFLAL